MKVLILNAGSSSLKYQLLDMDTNKLLAKGLVERIGIEGSRIQQKVDGKVFDAVAPMKTHTEGIQWMLKALTDAEKGAVKNMDEISDRTLKAAQVFLAILPILAVYPFLQKYFSKGVITGAIKG